MVTVQDIYQKLDEFCPFFTAMGFDNCGILVGSPSQEVAACVIALDITNEVIELAMKQKAQLIITHHPIIFHALKSVIDHERVFRLVQNNISVISAHTNLDIAQGGVNDVLAELFGLQNVRVFENADGVVRVGEIPEKTTGKQFAQTVKTVLQSKTVTVTHGEKEIQTVAVCGGSGGDYLQAVMDSSIDALVTGEADHDVVIDAINYGCTLICAGHHYTEAPVLATIETLIQNTFPSVKTHIYRDFLIEAIS